MPRVVRGEGQHPRQAAIAEIEEQAGLGANPGRVPAEDQRGVAVRAPECHPPQGPSMPHVFGHETGGHDLQRRAEVSQTRLVGLVAFQNQPHPADAKDLRQVGVEAV